MQILQYYQQIMNETQNSMQRKLQHMYRQVETLISQLLDKITDIYHKNGIRYFIKPTSDVLMRLLTPYELKVYVGIDDIYCLFQKSELNPNSQTSTKQLMRNKESYISMKEEVFPNLRQSKTDIGLDKNIYRKKSKREREREIKQYNKNRMKQILVQQLLNWGRKQVKDGQIITRKRMTDKALQIGNKYERKFGIRWLNKFITFDSQLRNLLTHGNCLDLKQNTNKEPNKKVNSEEAGSQEFGDNNSSQYGIDQLQ